MIIDDEAAIGKLLAGTVQHMGHEAVCTETLTSGLAAIRDNDFDVVYLDVILPDGNGLDALPMIKTGRSAPETIIITGRGDPDGAALAVESGAWDYIQKPLSLKDISLQLHQVLRYREEKKTGRRVLKRDKIIGNSPEITHCLEMVCQDKHILVRGLFLPRSLARQILHEEIKDLATKDTVIRTWHAIQESSNEICPPGGQGWVRELV